MNLKCGLFAAAIVLGISTHSLADSKGDALDLLNRGAATVAIANKVPILIEARTSITHGNDSPRNGLLRLIFVDEQNWRQEYKDDFYEETETSRSGMVFTNADYEKRPFPLDEIYASLHHLLPMHPPDGYKPEKIKEVQKDGAKYRCLLFRRGKHADIVYCFDSHGRLAERGEETSTTAFSDYRPIRNGSFPFRMTHSEGPANTTALIELQHVTDTPANLAVPPNAAAYPYCDPPENPNPVSLEDPPYPKALASRKGSPPVTVVLGCYIDTSGNVRKEEVLSSAGKDWDEAAVIGASRWKFSPAACRGTPVPLHSVFTINFVKR